MSTQLISLLIMILVVVNATIGANYVYNPDGTCTNPKFRWFDELNAFYNWSNMQGNNNTIPAIRVNISLNTNARCLDGSQYFFYFRKGFGDGVNKFQIYLQGGGWCTSPQSCYNRAQPSNDVGSSLGYTKYAWYSSYYLSDNQTINPLMYNWNTAWLLYCDGSSFTGNNMTVYSYNSKDLYFRGHQNLMEGMKLLYNNYGLENASDVVLSGCSAGGMAVYLNNDYIFNNFVNENAQKRFLSIAVSGFFPYNNPINTKSNWYQGILWIFNTQNVSNNLNVDCVNYYNQINKPISNCLFAQYVSPFLIKNKIFALQSIYDVAGLQTQGINTNNDAETTSYGQWFSQLFINQYININTSLHSGLLYSCYSHCGEFNDINISNIISGDAIQMFYNNNLDLNNVLFQNATYPCNDCCFSNYVVPPPKNISFCPAPNERCVPACNE